MNLEKWITHNNLEIKKEKSKTVRNSPKANKNLPKMENKKLNPHKKRISTRLTIAEAFEIKRRQSKTNSLLEMIKEDSNPKTEANDLTSLPISEKEKLTFEDIKNSIKFVLSKKINESESLSKRFKRIENEVNEILNYLHNDIRNLESYLKRKKELIIIFREENNRIMDKVHKIKNILFRIRERVFDDHFGGFIKILGQRSFKQVKGNLRRNSELEMHSEIEVIKESRDLFIEKVKRNNAIIEETLENVSKLKKDLQNYRETKNFFMLELMKKAIDCRKVGIVWLIKYFISIGQKIKFEYFPNFLDQESKDFLISKAYRLIELEDKEAMIKVLQESYKMNMYELLNSSDVKIQNNILNFSRESLHNSSMKDSPKQNEAIISSFKVPENKRKGLFHKTERRSTNHKFNKPQIFNTGDSKKIRLAARSSSIPIFGRSPTLNEENETSSISDKKITDRDEVKNLSKTNFDEKLKMLVFGESYTEKKNINSKKTENDYVYEKSSQKVSEITFKEGQFFCFDTTILNHFENQFLIFDNDIAINNFSNREEFFKYYEDLQKQLKELQIEILENDKKELYRIKREFLFREYGKKYSISFDILISTLFGFDTAIQEASNRIK